MQPSERARVCVCEYRITDTVGQLWFQLPLALSARDGREHLRDRKFRDHQTESATQKRIEPFAFGFGYVKLRQGAGIDVQRGLGRQTPLISFVRFCHRRWPTKQRPPVAASCAEI